MTTMTRPNLITDANKLSILISSRIRLDDNERAALKQAYQTIKAGYQPKNQPTVNGSSITVETAFTANQLDTALGMNSYTFSDILSSRESMSITMLLRLQEVLGVTVVNKERMLDAYESYLNHIMPNG